MYGATLAFVDNVTTTTPACVKKDEALMATQMLMATLAFADSNAKDQRLLEHG